MAYVACEAANVERLAENGPLVQQVHEFFNAVKYVPISQPFFIVIEYCY